ncbi:transcription antitermination factor NusB [Limosilactobacillus antri]|uniref:Transcription antitermination protein NusB n=1 Tax=Limosilactobacillus antri DSM 16041 TaxID=525309 RepID=C8P959_9LACO|nr:transcription antitermination factor NusB [Limosilactobacillus antri]EEW52965.1 transcription antitermination factor NusB [Limosilactobacillus antri DSM 16041]KRK56210.1 N utilization substance protein B [Limosilactobacillus antri DSM 16041]
MSLTRHALREEAFQVLFALQTNPEADLATIYRSIPHHDERALPDYVRQLATGVSERQADLDEQISGLLASDWTIDRLAKADLIILRLALYELQYVDEVPTAVAINEALELAKEFSSDQSRKFINGALGRFEKENNL